MLGRNKVDQYDQAQNVYFPPEKKTNNEDLKEEDGIVELLAVSSSVSEPKIISSIANAKTN